MTTSHVTGAGLGAAAAVVIFRVTGWKLSESDALVVGAAALSVGVGVGHAARAFLRLIPSVGICGAVKVLLHGQPSVTH